MNNSTLIIPCDRIENIQVTDVGAKALQLWRIRQLGLATPDWLVVTSAAMRQELEPLQSRLDSALRQLRAMSDVPRVAGILSDILADFRLSDSFTRQLNCAVYHQFGVEPRLAVRSSATCEDGPHHSFAGQFASFLNVLPTDVCVRVVDVWRSQYSAGVLAYRLKKGLNPAPPPLAVIVQELIKAQASGVMFTREPDTLDRRVVVSAAYGLGEGVVSNRAEADSYQLGWRSPRISPTIATKRNRVQATGNGHGGTEVCDVPSTLRSCPVLGWMDLMRLQRAARTLEGAFGCGLDIEWCVDSQRRLHILQARPITAAVALQSDESPRIWDNANIVESYPGITLPLTFSFIRANYEAIFRNAACGLMLNKQRMAAHDEIWTNMLGLLHGRVYYNLRNWYAMLSFLPGFRRHRQAWDAMIGIRHDTQVAARRLPWYDRLVATLRLCLFVISPGSLERKFFRSWQPLWKRHASIRWADLSDQEVLDRFRLLKTEAFKFWHLTLYIDFCAMKYFAWLKALCARWTGVDATDLHTTLLGGAAGTESARAIHSAVAIAEEIRGQRNEQFLFETLTPQELWSRLESDASLRKLHICCCEHLEQFGDRCSEELKLETLTPREAPQKFMALLRGYVRGHLTVAKLAELENARSSKGEKRLRAQVPARWKRAVLRLMLSRARQAVAGRENTRFARTRFYGVARGIFRHLGGRLVACRALATSADVHYLTLSEVCEFFEGAATTTQLSGLVAMRKADYERFCCLPLPARFETCGPPSLGILAEPPRTSRGSHHLNGTGCSSGLAEGLVAHLARPDGPDLPAHQIIVTESTDPSWAFVMINAAGLVAERGSVLSHTAILGRELGIPTVVNVPGATRLIPERARLRVNGGTGEIVWK